jgi:hypothetical protein
MNNYQISLHNITVGLIIHRMKCNNFINFCRLIHRNIKNKLMNKGWLLEIYVLPLCKEIEYSGK